MNQKLEISGLVWQFTLKLKQQAALIYDLSWIQGACGRYQSSVTIICVDWDGSGNVGSTCTYAAHLDFKPGISQGIFYLLTWGDVWDVIEKHCHLFLLTFVCVNFQLTAQVLENKDIGFGMVDSQKDAKVARKLGMACATIILQYHIYNMSITGRL